MSAAWIASLSRSLQSHSVALHIGTPLCAELGILENAWSRMVPSNFDAHVGSR